ncbi:MAC/perforin domain-containing protein [Pseudomonas gingeri]|uniref:MAC/perforin domain-containing protein n=1 Tax=Pseudomonas gingeri TaxID=117681 RepID=UPI0015A31191|nr:MAC/perforin domain-containing protein [Pseudomonas gingeri]NWD06553.1 hypothetical protein [Pseudomonas gingeri]NWD46507.1 hypothetical protein [Pseudomonas gingeri]NWE33167.1 hypothetical protein [Pseudomonas gingeri]NWE55496.1 hypothetical protein [Pseudomonas gingeri]NWF04015.1 hypothetical protein [Pseudomonas gingeri]
MSDEMDMTNVIKAADYKKLNGDLGYGRNRLSAARAPDERVFDPASGAGIQRHTDTRREDYSSFFRSILDYRRDTKIKFNTTASYGEFSAEFHLNFEKKYTSHQDNTAAVRTLRLVFGGAKLDAVSAATLSPKFTTEVARLPTVFSHEEAHKFYRFFDMFGTDVVTSITLGGTLYFQALVKKSKVTELEKIKIELEAEYGIFFTADGSIDDTVERKQYMESRDASVTTEGGDNDIFSDAIFTKPKKYDNKTNQWVASVGKKPVVVGREFKPVHAFIADDKRRIAAQTALDHYMGRYLSVHSTWSYSSLTVGNMKRRELASDAVCSPAIKVRVIDRKTLEGREQHFAAPAIGSAVSDINQFWNAFKSDVESMGLEHVIVLLATEFWPRESRYCPPDHIIAFLKNKCGGSEATLHRWRDDSLRCVPCPYAGISYGLIGYGNGTSHDKGGDAYVIGFGDPQRTLRPELEIFADLHTTEDGTAKFACNDIFQGEAIAFLKLRSQHWNTRQIAVDPHVPERVILEDDSAGDASKALWYAQPAGPKHDMHPVYLINAQTCGVLQWDSGGAALEKEAVLRPFAPNLDINLWDLRYPHILCLSYQPHWDLRAFDDRRVKVASYRSEDTELRWSPSDVSRVL